jgi:DNA-binding NarL/FixJ family response regulator
MNLMPTILIVEDEPDIRELIGLCLSEQGFEVLLAENGEEALALFKKEQPGLVILDVLLPGMDGFQVCRALRVTSKVPVLFLTCKHEADEVVAGLEAGGDDYIAKPFDLNVLTARVRANLRRVTEYVTIESAAAPSRSPTTAGQLPDKEQLYEPLTSRELEVLTLIKSGQSNQEIAARLHLTLGTVKGYNNQIFSKLGVKSRTQAVSRAEELRLW